MTDRLSDYLCEQLNSRVVSQLFVHSSGRLTGRFTEGLFGRSSVPVRPSGCAAVRLTGHLTVCLDIISVRHNLTDAVREGMHQIVNCEAAYFELFDSVERAEKMRRTEESQTVTHSQSKPNQSQVKQFELVQGNIL